MKTAKKREKLDYGYQESNCGQTIIKPTGKPLGRTFHNICCNCYDWHDFNSINITNILDDQTKWSHFFTFLLILVDSSHFLLISVVITMTQLKSHATRIDSSKKHQLTVDSCWIPSIPVDSRRCSNWAYFSVIAMTRTIQSRRFPSIPVDSRRFPSIPVVGQQQDSTGIDGNS